ncbi:MAG TPA: hypothetical protein VHD60_04625 [Candidatus Saccharimonadales bacterium]|nr:hypothetical protein [Candidatus Saccharimonadales bacterium]
MWQIIAIVYGASEVEVVLTRKGHVALSQVAFAPLVAAVDILMHGAHVVRRRRQVVNSPKKS